MLSSILNIKMSLTLRSGSCGKVSNNLGKIKASNRILFIFGYF